jgi:acyl-coenzyme A synthetase/AMP-(fatty) acid ligase
MLPFTAGVPFRRRRVEFPEELFALCKSTSDSYMIITVPAFLKRVAESDPEDFAANTPFIYTSGGAVPPDLAEKTNHIFGFWPLEVYGSTETSGIAFRQSRNGMEWTTFDNAGISKNEEGCLVIRSPYIKAPEGFVTGDLVDILPDGRFLLKGRADSIVKVEEKRISLPEVENRLLQSGMVSDVCVIALEDRRQYLAAAVVLNAQGKVRFAGVEKFDINRFFTEYLLRFFEPACLPKKWRYVDAIPLDAQGKKKKQDIKALFKG